MALQKTGLPITPSPSSIVPLELPPLVRGRTVPHSKWQQPASVGESFFFCLSVLSVCHVTSRALVDYAECHHLLCSGLEGVGDGNEAEKEEEEKGG